MITTCVHNSVGQWWRKPSARISIEILGLVVPDDCRGFPPAGNRLPPGGSGDGGGRAPDRGCRRLHAAGLDAVTLRAVKIKMWETASMRISLALPLIVAALAPPLPAQKPATYFPAPGTWQKKAPAEVGMDAAKVTGSRRMRASPRQQMGFRQRPGAHFRQSAGRSSRNSARRPTASFFATATSSRNSATPKPTIRSTASPRVSSPPSAASRSRKA